MAKFDWSQFQTEDQVQAKGAGKFWDQFDAEPAQATPTQQSDAKPLAGNAPATTAGQAYLEHTQNALTFGHMPQIQGAIQMMMPDPGKSVDQDLAAKGFKITQPKFNDYVGTRDAAISRLKQEEEDSPRASLLGTGTGILASGFGVGAAARAVGAGAKALELAQAAKAAQAAGDTAQASKLMWAARLARFGNAATTAVVQGAAQNPGDTEGKVQGLQLDDRLANAKNTLGTGLAIQGLGEAAPALVKAAGSNAGRALIGGAIGYHHDGLKGAIEGAAAGEIAGHGGAKKAMEKAAAYLPQAIGALQNNPAVVQRLAQGVVSPTQNQGFESADNNPDANQMHFANQGAQKLGLDADTLKATIGSKEGRRLLIEASILPQGSKRLSQIMDQIQKGGSR